MSCVVGIVENGIIYMGADTAATSEYEIRTFREKIFLNRSVIVGYCGSIRPGQLLSPGQWTPPVSIGDFPNSLRKTFNDGGCLKNGEGGGDYINCEFLFGYKKQIFEIGSDFHIIHPIENYTAVGSGRPYALGSLYETSKVQMTPEERIQKALECSSFFCPDVREPFIIYSTEKMSKKGK